MRYIKNKPHELETSAILTVRNADRVRCGENSRIQGAHVAIFYFCIAALQWRLNWPFCRSLALAINLILGPLCWKSDPVVWLARDRIRTESTSTP